MQFVHTQIAHLKHFTKALHLWLYKRYKHLASKTTCTGKPHKAWDTHWSLFPQISLYEKAQSTTAGFSTRPREQWLPTQLTRDLNTWLSGVLSGECWQQTHMSWICISVYSGTWWHIGQVDDSQPEGRGFDSRSSRHVGTLGKSFTYSYLCAYAWNSDTVSVL